MGYKYNDIDLIPNDDVRPPRKDEYFVRDGIVCQAACNFRDNVFNQVVILIPTIKTPAKGEDDAD